MVEKIFLSSLLLYSSLSICGSKIISTLENKDVSFSLELASDNLQFTLKQGEIVKLQGTIGTRLSRPLNYAPCSDVENCFEFPDDNTKLHIMNSVKNGFAIYWISNDTMKVLEDCIDHSTHSWYGGPERFEQKWPIEKLTLDNVPQEDQWGAVLEPYWLNSVGGYAFVNERVPLFINQNNQIYSTNKVCFSAKSTSPYSARKKIVLHYTVVSTENAKEGHLHAVGHFLGKPTGHPNNRIIRRPIWSTWARYKRAINDSAVLAFAQEIIDHGYANGQFEIDDDWEDCYGAFTFTKSRFGNITDTVKLLKEMNFTVSLWVHPFVNVDCIKYAKIGKQYGYFVKNTEGSDLTQWWNSGKQGAHYLDFTKMEVREWFVERLRTLRKIYGIDSFKFDAGEITWAPMISELDGDIDTAPNQLTADYVRTCALLGDLVEVRSAWRTQDLPIFVRMLDKDSEWGSNNGLYTLITTLLQMNLNGYTMVLPDMVGGNGYNGKPSAELFIRWLQANVFMPSIQFSYVPWDYDAVTEYDVKEISMKMVKLHEKFAPYIEKQMHQSINLGHPVNAPLWWVDPSDTIAQKVDSEFLLGEDVLVAPIILEGATYRNVYLPKGTWIDGNNGDVFEGPMEIVKYNATIEVLPYFVRRGSEAEHLNGSETISLSVGAVFVVILRLLLIDCI